MISIDLDGPLARLFLRRPAARNALAMADWEDLAAQLAALSRSSARVLVITGEGGAFCAGADLKEFDRLLVDEAARIRFRTAMRAGIEALQALDLATIAFIDGPCYGAGVALTMACDMRLATSAARFAITPAKIGIGYPQEDVHRLVALVGPGHAARLLFTGASIDAQEAHRIGLVEEVGQADRLEALIGDLLACDPDSIVMLKRGIALALAGARVDADQDRRFDALLGSPAAAARLSQRRTGRSLPPSPP